MEAGVVVVNEDDIREQPSGSDNKLPFAGGTAVGPYANGMVTEQLPFSAGQDGHFSEDVVVQCTWNQPDPELPTGEYSGMVIFTALIP